MRKSLARQYAATMKDFDPLDTRQQARIQRDADTRLQIELEQEKADFKWLMSSQRGRRIVWRQLERAGVFRLSFNTNSMTMAFNDGQKNEGLRLIARIHTWCPELYPTMVREATNANRTSADDGNRNGQ